MHRLVGDAHSVIQTRTNEFKLASTADWILLAAPVVLLGGFMAGQKWIGVWRDRVVLSLAGIAMLTLLQGAATPPIAIEIRSNPVWFTLFDTLKTAARLVFTQLKKGVPA